MRTKMDLDNMKFEIIHNKFKKCGFCGKELVPKGLDYLYANISPDTIEFQRCDCEKAQEHWKKIDEQEYKAEKRKHFRKIINEIYKENYIGRKFQEKNFENFNINSENEVAVNVAKDYTNKRRFLLRKNNKRNQIKDEKSETRMYGKMFNDCKMKRHYIRHLIVQKVSRKVLGFYKKVQVFFA